MKYLLAIMNTLNSSRLAGLIVAIAWSAWSPSALAEGDAAAGADIGYTCKGCHGIEGYRNAYPSFRVPRLGGQKSAYVREALLAYRAGTRPHPTMQAQASSLTDDDIDNIVAWLATFGAAEDTTTAEQVAGFQAAQICATCHGVDGAAVQPTPPTLAGQHEDYLVHALNSYKDGTRGGNVMTAFAATLTDADMAAIAKFYARQDGVKTLK
jgi:cytochrome c553